MTHAAYRPATTVTYLEMSKPQAVGCYPRLPDNHLVIKSQPVAEWYFLGFYRGVGADLYWTDLLHDGEARREFLARGGVSMHVLHAADAPLGFYVLDADEDSTDLSYFGLAPEGQGRGLGYAFLGHAIVTAWQRPGINRMTVNTCTLDHPAALALYQRAGFVIEHQENRPALNIPLEAQHAQ